MAFAKLYDVGPDGAIELPHRLISPVRVADVDQAGDHRAAGRSCTASRPGHRLVVVLAGGDMAYRGSTAPQPVTLTTGPGADPAADRAGRRLIAQAAAAPDVLAHPVDDVGRRRAGREDVGDAEPLELGDVLVGDDPAAEDDDVVDAALAP